MSPDRDSNEQYRQRSFRTRESDPDHRELDQRGSFRRSPPVVPERVEVMKANYKQAWLYFLLVVCLIVAWGIPLRYAVIRALAFRAEETGPRNSTEFVAIAFEGISEMPGEVTPERFREQITALKEAGYNAITLEDVRDFYTEGRLLPERAILLTFDHSRKSSYFDARRILQRAGWRAVMFVWTLPILDEDPAALRWPYIRAMIGTGAWEAGAQSHLGFGQITTSSDGRLQNFMSAPQWIPEESRFETPEEFHDRLHEDHSFVVDLIRRETRVAPVAFAFPYGDFGQFDERANLTRRLNMELAREFYDLAFLLGNAALNTANSDPFRLNRMLVDSDWSAEELLYRLDAAWPQNEGLRAEDILGSPIAWQEDWGGFALDEGRASFFATDETTGSKVWLNGTDMYQDFQARFRLNIDQGQVGFFLRATKDGDSHLYFALGDRGEVWLRQKNPGMEAVTLGTSRYTVEEGGTVDLSLYIRGNQLFASTGGTPVFDEIITIRGTPQAGLVGLSVWHPQPGRAGFDLLDFEIMPFSNRLITFEPLNTRLPHLAGWMEHNAYRYTHFSPPWLQLGSQGRGEMPGWDLAFYTELSSIYNLKFAPEVRVEQIDTVDADVFNTLASRAVEANADALFCNLTYLRGTPNVAGISSWIQRLGRALARHDMELILSLPPGLNRSNTVNSLLQSIPNLTIAASENLMDDINVSVANRYRLATTFRTVIPERAYPLFRQITPGDAPRQAWAQEVRSQVLWEQGFESFHEGDFDGALELWTRWMEQEPFNEQAPRLIGDVHLTRQDYGDAITYYQQSLELNPGQIDLVVNTAFLIEHYADRQQEAARMLSLYQRLFPENSEIALAQAGLLLRQNRPVEAGMRVEDVIHQNPGDISARALLHPLLGSAEDRFENLEQILRSARRLGVITHFATTVRNHNLLIWPESWALYPLIEERAELPGRDGELYQKLLPRDTVVRERFRIGSASDQWDDTSFNPDQDAAGNLYLAAAPTSSEASLILKRSETMRNGFIEAELEDSRGFFWLYARRSEGNMIRFGFETAGRLYLQIWQDEQIHTNLVQEWRRPADRVRLRLEIRGDAIYAYIDGRPAFGAPVDIPRGMNLGWWGMAPWAPSFGVAQAVVREVAGGPLPVNLGLFQSLAADSTDAMLAAKIRPNTDELSVVSPPWFFMDVSGAIHSELNDELRSLRLLCRFYKIRLYPLIRSASTRRLDLDSLVQLAREHRVDGFTLSFARMPDESWFEEVDRKLIGSGIGLIAVQVDPAGHTVALRESGDGIGLIPGARRVQHWPLVDLSEEEDPTIENLDWPMNELPITAAFNNSSASTNSNPTSNGTNWESDGSSPNSEENGENGDVETEGAADDADERPKDVSEIEEEQVETSPAPSVESPKQPSRVYLF